MPLLTSSPPSPRSRGRTSRSDRLKSSAATCILDESHSDWADDTSENNQNDTNLMDQSTMNHQVQTNRFWRSVTAVSRSLSPMRRHSGSAGRPRSASPTTRQLPKRQVSIETATSEESDEEDERCWEEQRVELLERMEALESKLKTKEAILQSLVQTTAAKSNRTHSFTARSAGPLAAMLLEKDKVLAQMEARVKQQAIRMERLESQQQERVQKQAELLFQEWQQEEANVSVWEQLQEQNEKIATLQAENEYQRQVHERQQKHNKKLIQELLAEKRAREAEDDEETKGSREFRSSTLTV